MAGEKRRFRASLSVPSGSVRLASSLCLLVLPQDSAVWLLEKDVVAGIASLKTCVPLQTASHHPHLSPPNSRSSAGKLSIKAPSTTIRLFSRTVIECSGTNVQSNLPCTTLEQGLERRSHRPLMRYPKPIKLIQRIIVISDDFVCRFEIKACHKAPFMFHESHLP